MKEGIKYLFNFIVVMALLVSTTGVTIYTHYCNSEGQMTNSLFLNEVTCSPEATMYQHDCCNAEKTYPVDKTPGCCSDVKYLYKIDNTYYTSNPESLSPEPIVLQLYNELVFDMLTDSDMPVGQPLTRHHLPPISGKELITRILQFKIAPDPLA